jgi:hypothetical protein
MRRIEEDPPHLMLAISSAILTEILSAVNCHTYSVAESLTLPMWYHLSDRQALQVICIG